MQPYKNLSGNSGVTAFTSCPQSIIIQFSNGLVYIYSYHSTGKSIVENMKELARAGKGLSTYISRFVRENFEKKITLNHGLR